MVGGVSRATACEMRARRACRSVCAASGSVGRRAVAQPRTNIDLDRGKVGHRLTFTYYMGS